MPPKRPQRPKPPIEIACERLHPILLVPDIGKAVKFYTEKLGFWCAFTWPEKGPKTFAGVNLGDVQVFFSKRKGKGSGGGVAFVVDDADRLYAFHRKRGARITEPIGDREYGLRDYGVKDLNGYDLSFGQYIYSVGEPLEIERVDVPVRLEKRMARVLEDLARLKRLSIAATLEETLLHTWDRLPDGTPPSPHTDAQSRRIQDLKKQHGIDYDSHGSYRFVERAPRKR